VKKLAGFSAILVLGGSIAVVALFAGLAPSLAATTTCTVPNVRGKTLPRARKAVARAHCRIGKLRRSYSKTTRKGRVISERPRPATVLPRRGKVNVVVSRGPRPQPPPPPSVSSLLLWNTLGSPYEIEHSAYGPNLAFFDCHDPSTPYFGERCQVDISGLLAFPPGVFGAAAGIADGPYFPGAREHTALLRESVLDPERGTVEAWYRQTSDPVPYEHNPHRIFGGPYSLTGVDEVQLFSQDRLDSGDPRLHFSVFFGDEPPPYTEAHVVAAHSLADGEQGYPISALNDSWIHVAGVWDRRGIAGSTDTLRLYVNGEVVAASRTRDWGRTPCRQRRPAGQWRCFTDIAGCNDTCGDAFAVDNLKLWSYAKTDYSDRFTERRR
jgi:PASTA domain